MCRIIQGAKYTYTAAMPAACTGHLYQVVGFILAVPAYQEQVLVRCLSGPDVGRWFACSPWNFTTRYQPEAEVLPAPVVTAAPLPERVFGIKSRENA